MTNENYFVVQGWMINELNLKGNELLIYAIIYGFSQADGHKFTGSRQYIADFINSTKSCVQTNLNSLVEKGLLIKEEYIKNSVKYCSYTPSIKSLLPDQKMVYPRPENGLNNIDNNIDIELSKDNSTPYSENSLVEIKKKSKYPSLDEVIQFAKIKYPDINTDVISNFYEYYSVNDWRDKKNEQVKNWKSRLSTWVAHNKDFSKPVYKKKSNSYADTISKTVDDDFYLMSWYREIYNQYGIKKEDKPKYEDWLKTHTIDDYRKEHS